MRPLALALLLSVGTAAAQSLPDWAAQTPAPPHTAPMAMPPDPPESGGGVAQVPLDGGLGLLALAGGLFGASRLRRDRARDGDGGEGGSRRGPQMPTR